jgi:beta-galactosidase
MVRSRFLYLSVFLMTISSVASVPADNKIWPRPTIPPLPATVAGISRPVVLLNGTWKINLQPGPDFWKEDANTGSWRDIVVPSQANMQGMAIPRDHPYAYQTRIEIPKDFAGKKILLRFEGVTGTARAWIDGVLVGQHVGGFTVWYCDITDQVAAGKQARLTVAVTEPQPHASTEGYEGGIIRDVKLVAFPQQFVSRFAIETDFDAQFQNGTLRVWVRLSNVLQQAELRFALKDPAGQAVPL